MNIAVKNAVVGIWGVPVVVEITKGSPEPVQGPEQALHYLLLRWPTKRGARYEQALAMTAMCVEGHGVCEQTREAFSAAAVEANVFCYSRMSARAQPKLPSRH